MGESTSDPDLTSTKGAILHHCNAKIPTHFDNLSESITSHWNLLLVSPYYSKFDSGIASCTELLLLIFNEKFYVRSEIRAA